MQGEAVTTISELFKLAGSSLAMTLAIILGGSYFEIWVWGKTCREEIADLKQQIEELKVDRNYWKGSTLELLNGLRKARHVRERIGERS